MYPTGYQKSILTFDFCRTVHRDIFLQQNQPDAQCLILIVFLQQNQPDAQCLILIVFLQQNQPDAQRLIFIVFLNYTLHVSGGLSVHHQESKTVHIPDVLCTLWAGWRSSYSDWLRAVRSGDRIPMEPRFSAPVQTGPGAHPASCTMGTGSFPEVKSGRGVMLTPHPF